MQLPLALRALFRAPTRQLISRLTWSPSWWAPSDARRADHWDPMRLAASTTAGAVRDAMTGGVPVSAATPARELRRLQALHLALLAGHLSPALLDWCVRHAHRSSDIVTNLLANPAITPPNMHAVRGFIEERAWRADVTHQLDGGVSAPLADTAVAWLAARHPAEPLLTCSPFMARVVAQSVGDVLVLQSVFTLLDIPAVVDRAIRRLVARDDFPTIRAVCRHAPRIMTMGEIEDLVLQDRPVSRPWFVSEIFDVLPTTSRQTLWRTGFAARPRQTVQQMATFPGTRWPGLTIDDLGPLLTDPSTEIRLAAIQLLAGLDDTGRIPNPAPANGRSAGEEPDRGPSISFAPAVSLNPGASQASDVPATALAPVGRPLTR